MSLDATLARGLADLALTADDAMRARLLAYVHLLDKWNRVYNLTAVRDVAAMLVHHVLDSAAVVPHLSGVSLVDVGSGGGLPGLPIAILCPQRHVTLLDSNHKKATFLRQAVIELALTNVTVTCERAEAWHPPQRFDVVISRAFAELAQFVTVAAHLCAPGGVMIAMKGVHPDEELASVPAGCAVAQVRRLTVPGLSGDRHLVFLQPNTVDA